MNVNCEFKRNFKSIYRKQLEQYRVNNSSSSAVLIAAEIKNDYGRFYESLVDKRDTFPFSIVKIPYKQENSIYNILFFSCPTAAEILRRAKACLRGIMFCILRMPPLKRMENQTAITRQVINVVNTFIHKTFSLFTFRKKF